LRRKNCARILERKRWFNCRVLF